MIANIIIIGIVVLIIASIVTYLVRAKRRGDTCVGCPYAKACGGNECNTQNQKALTPDRSQAPCHR